MILEHYAHSDATDKPTRLLIESIIEQIQTFIADPQFESLAKETSVDDSGYRLYEDSPDYSRVSLTVSGAWGCQQRRRFC